MLIGSLMRGRLLTSVLGLIAGLGLAMVWPKLAPVATCLQDSRKTSFRLRQGRYDCLVVLEHDDMIEAASVNSV